MKHRLTALSRLTLLASLTATPDAAACQFDTDCSPGSKCVKPSSQIYGACTGGLLPGNANDRVPVFDPLDLNGTFGNTCSFDVDCGPGSTCVKGTGIYGTCFRRSRVGGWQSRPVAPPTSSYGSQPRPYGWVGGLGAGLMAFSESLRQYSLNETLRKQQESQQQLQLDPLVQYILEPNFPAAKWAHPGADGEPTTVGRSLVLTRS